MRRLTAKRLGAVQFGAMLFVSAFLSACASNAASDSPLIIPHDIAGIVHSGHTNTPEEYALLDRLGSSWTLTTFSWREIEPVENQWDFDSYDEFVDTAKEAGIKIIGLLAYDVGWIYDDGERHRNITPDKLDFFLNYARHTATHFRDRVDAWCIWNEPNFRHFWKGSREDFLLLSRKTADVVREVDPDVIILGGAFNRGVFGLPKAYIKGLFESGAMEKADGVAFHPYEMNPARATKLYDKFRTLVAPYGFADKIWITEAGYPTGGRYPTKTTEKKFPEYVVKTFVNLAVGGVPTILWYQLFDPPSRAEKNSEDFFGLVRSREDYTSKGAEAFRLCAVHLAGTVYRPSLPHREGLPDSLRMFHFEQPTGGGTLVLWKEGISAPLRLNISNSPAVASGPDAVSGGLTNANGGTGNIANGPPAASLTAHDPVSGSAVAIHPHTTITVGSMPIFVTWDGGGEIRITKENKK